MDSEITCKNILDKYDLSEFLKSNLKVKCLDASTSIINLLLEALSEDDYKYICNYMDGSDIIYYIIENYKGISIDEDEYYPYIYIDGDKVVKK